MPFAVRRGDRSSQKGGEGGGDNKGKLLLVPFTRVIKVRAKRLLITEEANPLRLARTRFAISRTLGSQGFVQVSLPPPIPHVVSQVSLLKQRRDVSTGTAPPSVVYSACSLEIPLRILLLERVCVTVISVATLSRLSGAFPPPNSRPSR